MLTDKDVQKITKANEKIFVTKEDFEKSQKENISKTIYAYEKIFATKDELEDFREEMRKSFSDLLTSVDTYAKRADGYFQEMLVLSHKLERHEKWIHQVAKKLGVKLDY